MAFGTRALPCVGGCLGGRAPRVYEGTRVGIWLQVSQLDLREVLYALRPGRLSQPWRAVRLPICPRKEAPGSGLESLTLSLSPPPLAKG